MAALPASQFRDYTVHSTVVSLDPEANNWHGVMQRMQQAYTSARDVGQVFAGHELKIEPERASLIILLTHQEEEQMTRNCGLCRADELDLFTDLSREARVVRNLDGNALTLGPHKPFFDLSVEQQVQMIQTARETLQRVGSQPDNVCFVSKGGVLTSQPLHAHMHALVQRDFPRAEENEGEESDVHETVGVARLVTFQTPSFPSQENAVVVRQDLQAFYDEQLAQSDRCTLSLVEGDSRRPAEVLICMTNEVLGAHEQLSYDPDFIENFNARYIAASSRFHQKRYCFFEQTARTCKTTVYSGNKELLDAYFVGHAMPEEA